MDIPNPGNPVLDGYTPEAQKKIMEFAEEYGVSIEEAEEQYRRHLDDQAVDEVITQMQLG